MKGEERVGKAEVLASRPASLADATVPLGEMKSRVRKTLDIDEDVLITARQ